jgi:predicted nucleic acid-binding protein
MSFLWDSNILRHYLENHPLLLSNLKKVPRHLAMFPVVVVAEQLRGRAHALLTAEPSRLAHAQEIFRQTQALLSRFRVLDFDEQSLAVARRLTEQTSTRKRYADVLIAAQALAGHHILVTRNTAHFRDLLPGAQLQNWVDDNVSG